MKGLIVPSKRPFQFFRAQRRVYSVLHLALLSLLLAACGGGGGGGGGESPASTHAIGGTVSGLTGSLVLQNNGADNLTVSADGSFTFNTVLSNSTAYAVTILTQPTGQMCSVSNGSGTVSGAAVVNIAINCISIYSIGGTVSGLSGSLVLQNNGADNLTVSANGSFAFNTALSNSTAYAVTVLTEPASQDCTVTSGVGTVADANVVNIVVQCAMGTPTIALAYQATKIFHFTWTDVSGETEYRLLENPDGSSGFAQIATLAAGSTSHNLSVPLFKRINASYILQACNAGYCTDSAAVSVSGTLAGAIGYMQASNTTAADFFGVSLALSGDGNTFVVGANGEDSAATGVGGDQSSTASAASGAVYVFTRSGTTWSQQAYIKASNTQADDRFGGAVALSSDGNTLVAGAIGEDSAATGVGGSQGGNGASSSGAVYVFTRSGTTWSQQAYVKASNPGGIVFFGYGDQFGQSLDLAGDGNTLAVGAIREDSDTVGIDGNQLSNAAEDSGAVYVFTRTGTAWSQQAYVKASNTGISDFFGYSVALSSDGDTLAIGASAEDSAAEGIGGDQASNAAEDSGAVYVFTRSGTAWSQQAYVKASNTQAEDEFGEALALSSDGNTLVVGAVDEDSAATGINGDQFSEAANGSGAVYAFIRSGPTWSQQAYIKASNTSSSGSFDSFGYSVALSGDGNTLAAGALGGDPDSSLFYSGSAYLY